ncbi:unnamed protein product [Ranitomeya imitator]|uniref:EF-hand domain-containing protein n=1 Tax=Ranitomeya imitator TaxID=111125 RepID=A0ABN9MD61_9NEOB|nr:unnamed protein product [Ranitomeya imitator]
MTEYDDKEQIKLGSDDDRTGKIACYIGFSCLLKALGRRGSTSIPLVEIREAFRILDRDGNGFISKQELGMAMRSLGYMPSEVELAIIMQRLDMDGKHQYSINIFTSKLKKLITTLPSQCTEPESDPDETMVPRPECYSTGLHGDTEEGAQDIEEEVMDDPVFDPDWQPLGEQ